MATVIPPYRTAEQRREALVLANKVRVATADECRMVEAMTIPAACSHVADLLDGMPDVAVPMRVGRLLRSIRCVGRGKASDWLSLCGVRSLDRRVGELSERQRVRLALLVREFGRRKAAGK